MKEFIFSVHYFAHKILKFTTAYMLDIDLCSSIKPQLDESK